MNLSLWILRWLRRGSLPVEIGRTFHFISDAITLGLCLFLWLSGLGFLALYAMESPEKFENPRLWANVIVVIVLTINGVIIRAFVLPETLRDLSRLLLFGVSRRRAALFLAAGAASGVSWYTAFAFGIFRELNNSVTFTLLVIMWLTLIIAASLAAILPWLNSAAGSRRSPSLSPPI